MTQHIRDAHSKEAIRAEGHWGCCGRWSGCRRPGWVGNTHKEWCVGPNGIYDTPSAYQLGQLEKCKTHLLFKAEHGRIVCVLWIQIDSKSLFLAQSFKSVTYMCPSPNPTPTCFEPVPLWPRTSYSISSNEPRQLLNLDSSEFAGIGSLPVPLPPTVSPCHSAGLALALELKDKWNTHQSFI